MTLEWIKIIVMDNLADVPSGAGVTLYISVISTVIGSIIG